MLYLIFRKKQLQFHDNTDPLSWPSASNTTTQGTHMHSNALTCTCGWTGYPSKNREDYRLQHTQRMPLLHYISLHNKYLCSAILMFLVSSTAPLKVKNQIIRSQFVLGLIEPYGTQQLLIYIASLCSVAETCFLSPPCLWCKYVDCIVPIQSIQSFPL